jgi:hypothetical protein
MAVRLASQLYLTMLQRTLRCGMWNNAKDVSIRIAGMDKSVALGNSAKAGVVDLP